MINLYLDDLRPGPHNGYFENEPGWEDWVVVRSVENAKLFLEMGIVNDLSLDHDMGYNSMVGGPNPNGRVLVLWMIEQNIWPKGNIFVHSGNLTEAMKMRDDIDRHRPKEDSETANGE